MIICAGESESFEFATPMGIGLIDTAINLTKRCITNPPKSILFIGSAGSYGNHEIFDIVESISACNIENSFFNANAYTPIKDILLAINNNVSHETLDNEIVSRETMEKTSVNDIVSRETIINSSNYITTDETLSKSYQSKNIGLENMEFYAVLKVAKAFEIPASGVFIVTNYCNKNAHRDFISNHKEAMSILTKYINSKHS